MRTPKNFQKLSRHRDHQEPKTPKDILMDKLVSADVDSDELVFELLNSLEPFEIIDIYVDLTILATTFGSQSYEAKTMKEKQEFVRFVGICDWKMTMMENVFPAINTFRFVSKKCN